MALDAEVRCGWALADAALTTYHDTEWGVPIHDDRLLFETLNLEGAQAGLSWLTILKRRAGYRRAFDNFDATTIAAYSPERQAALLLDDGIVRNRLKVNAVVENAKALLAVRDEVGAFDTYIWRFVGGAPLDAAQSPHGQAISALLSNDLRKHGFRFVGPTICYAFMQAAGLVNDHEPGCFRYAAVAAMRGFTPGSLP